MTRYMAVNDIRKALEFVPDACPYHADQFDFLGMAHGEPRCESCRPAFYRARAMRAVEHVDTTLIELQAESRELAKVRRDLTQLRMAAEAVGKSVDDLREAATP